MANTESVPCTFISRFNGMQPDLWGELQKANKKYPGLTPGAAFDFTLADYRVYPDGALLALPLGLVGGDMSICPVLQVQCLSFLKGRACHMPYTPPLVKQWRALNTD